MPGAACCAVKDKAPRRAWLAPAAIVGGLFFWRNFTGV